jgi:hypothetical protein
MGGTDWIDLTLDNDRWRAFVNAAKNFLVQSNAGNILAS